MNGADELLATALHGGLADTPAILAGEREISYSELAAAACRCGGALRECGVEAQDRVLLLVDDSPEFFLAYLGAMKIGAVPVALNLRTSAGELGFIIEDSGCKLIVVGPEFAALLDQAALRLKAMPMVVLSEGQSDERPGLADLMKDQPAELDSVSLGPDDMALWMYTSGTTGTPKAAVHRLRSLRAADRYLGAVYGVKPGERLFCTSKLFFAFSLGHILLAGLRLGAAAVLNAGWPSAKAIAAVVERHRPDVVFSVPTLYRSLLEEDLAGWEAFRSVRHFISAGERLPESLFRQWLAATGHPILEGIGATEALMMFLGNRPDDYCPGATGKPFPGIDVRLVGETGETIADADTPGVLWVRSECLAARYWNQEARTAAAFDAGWYRTGDVFVRDGDGRYQHQGRADDMLKISGQWVGPAEIEEAVLGNAKVSEAAVVGFEDGDGFIRLALCLVPRDPAVDRETLERELTDALTAELSIYKCPRRFVYLEELPKTATGKMQRFKLRAVVAEKLLGPS
ncbi:MAG: benzoate-CoA ligase family protein [Rhodospirillales bacterium]|nr:benzoate-CoA ligase family protein [Rhodospirillales bacterium]MDH3790196.1 benzoate-CoA ligase family protein [Rhodospirillales bacterium]MDH3912843.1 benzoate-CoA ligase family protein [Rhodospirillales bacterium]MDH3917457.1 benzoate-CoA ligase family protein [Rhodospirillales bacterium]MDH3968163.1 benzoate-CoA ligase family protein [Rhodospirillales bacterium]